MTENNHLSQKKHIAFITPWPPQLSGIAEYTYDLVRALNSLNQFQITIITSCPKPLPLTGVHIVCCRDENKLPNLVEFDLLIHQIGNNPMHILNYWVLKKYRGVVQLHDLDVSDLVRHIAISNGKAGGLYRSIRNLYIPEFLSRFLRRLYGPGFFYKTLRGLGVPSNFNDILQKWHGDNAVAIENNLKKNNNVNHLKNAEMSYPLFEELLQYADSVIVHSKFAQNKIQQKFPHLLVTQFTLLHLMENNDTQISSDKIKIGSFGFSDQYKHTQIIIKSFAELLQFCDVNHKPKPMLILAGPSDFKKESQLLNELQMADHTQLISYPSLTEFNALMREMNLVIQLRYPTRGETSGPVTKALQLGIPIIVSNNGWYQELPEFIEKTICPPEVNNIFATLLKILYPNDRQMSYSDRSLLAKNYAQKLDFNDNIMQYAKMIDVYLSYYGIRFLT